jgi:Holliday junction resolvasome RuvABC endonuclease subunit
MAIEHKSDLLPRNLKLYVGIDQSLSCTSVAFLYDGGLIIHRIQPKVVGVKRLDEINAHFLQLLEDVGGAATIDGMAIEGYAMGANGRVFSLGELGGVLRLSAFQHGLKLIEVPPKTLKKHLTGNGNASKKQMIEFINEKYNISIDNDNDADAAALALACYDYFEVPLHVVKTYRTYIQHMSVQIIGEHPNKMNINDYVAEIGDEKVGVVEKRKRGGAKKVILQRKI